MRNLLQTLFQKRKRPSRGPERSERPRRDRRTLSAQQTIPYVRMLPDGVCQLPGSRFTKTLAYEDINYSVASTEAGSYTHRTLPPTERGSIAGVAGG